MVVFTQTETAEYSGDSIVVQADQAGVDLFEHPDDLSNVTLESLSLHRPDLIGELRQQALIEQLRQAALVEDAQQPPPPDDDPLLSSDNPCARFVARVKRGDYDSPIDVPADLADTLADADEPTRRDAIAAHRTTQLSCREQSIRNFYNRRK